MSSIAIAMSLAMIMAYTVTFGSKLSLSSSQSEAQNRREDEINLVSNNLQTLLQNDQVWWETVSSSSNPGFACLRDKTNCCGTTDRNFVLTDTAGNVYYDPSKNAFNRRGEVCNNYGTGDCMYKPQLSWSAVNKGNSPSCHDVVISLHMQTHGSDETSAIMNMDLRSQVLYREPSSEDEDEGTPIDPSGTCAAIQKANKLVQYGLTKVASTSPWAALKTYCFISRIGQAGYDFATGLGLSCFFYIDSSGDQRILCSGGYKDMDLSIATSDYQKDRYLAAADLTQPKNSCSELGWIVKHVAGKARCQAPNASQPGGIYLKQALNASFTYCKHIIGGKVGSGIPVWCEGNFGP